ncbi:MAG TPA: aspartyl/glutamyl-tRNA amidotransferase subunit C [Brevefilum sp.]|nr:aspartyl/glutamyl-tRNA amidotransferase subunit C [Brevefilum sp.]HOR19696.1 aspartyl/glutamyl-tRNA amidotransferase subunit C [Brevefilum sp.]HPL69523.1 aspartyl/glutamyl-tRNA amidotransferase subunit C [Brevefilum sp.]
MRDEISPEIFAKLADLAAFRFNPEEAEYLRMELNQQLKAIRQLETLALDVDVPLVPRGVTYTAESRPPLRPDVWVPFENPEEILNQAPEVEDGYLIVPDIPHRELD